jgi:hypothetical protein
LAKKSTNINLTIRLDNGQQAAPEVEPWNHEFTQGRVVKELDEQRYTLTVAYPVNMPDVGKARDGKRDFASPEALEKAAWSYLQESPVVGRWHENGTEGAGQVVESYIWRFPDQVVKAVDGSEYTVTKGDWLVGVVWDEDSWADWKSGKAKGVSMQGKATRRTPSPLDIANLRRN